MPETPEELHARVAADLRMPPVETWDSFPFDGEMRPRPLRPAVAHEEPRQGEGGVDCERCAAQDDAYLWTSERWRPWAFDRPTGLPLIVLLEPRDHYAEPGDLPDGLAAELGILLARIERAVRSIGEIGRVHVCRWGDGSEHLHGNCLFSSRDLTSRLIDVTVRVPMGRLLFLQEGQPSTPKASLMGARSACAKGRPARSPSRRPSK